MREKFNSKIESIIQVTSRGDQLSLIDEKDLKSVLIAYKTALTVLSNTDKDTDYYHNELFKALSCIIGWFINKNNNISQASLTLISSALISSSRLPQRYNSYRNQLAYSGFLLVASKLVEINMLNALITFLSLGAKEGSDCNTRYPNYLTYYTPDGTIILNGDKQYEAVRLSEQYLAPLIRNEYVVNADMIAYIYSLSLKNKANIPCCMWHPLHLIYSIRNNNEFSLTKNDLVVLGRLFSDTQSEAMSIIKNEMHASLSCSGYYVNCRLLSTWLDSAID